MKIMHYALVIMIALAGKVCLAEPSVEINGLDGAEHWVWVEAENALGLTSSAVAQHKDTFGLSAGSLDPDMVWAQYVSGGAWSEFMFDLPSDFTEATLYFRYGCYSVKEGSQIYVDDELIGVYPFSHSDSSNWSIPNEMYLEDSLVLGNISAGSHVLKLVHTSSYTEYAYDGFLIYEGENVLLRNNTVTFGRDEWGPYYIDNPGSLAYPEIGVAAQPQIVFNEIDGMEYEVRLYKDGNEPIELLPGQIIDEPGQYELVVYVAGDGWRMNYYTGANFSIGTTGFCGDAAHPILPQDISEDCRIDTDDLKLFAAEWLDCNDPATLCDSL